MPKKRFTPYNIQVKKISKTINKEEKYFIQGSFDMYIGFYLNEKTSISYLIPIQKDGILHPLAKNIIFYAPYNGENGANALNRHKWVRDFSEVHNCSVFSLSINTDTANVCTPEKYYIYQEAGWYEVIFKIVSFIVQTHGIPSHKLFLCGQSSGASMIQRMVIAFPEKIAAVAAHGGGRIANFPSSPTTTPILLSVTLGDDISNIVSSKAKDAQKKGWNIWYAETMPKNLQDHHSASQIALNMMTDFILSAINNTDIMKIYETKSENIPVFFSF